MSQQQQTPTSAVLNLAADLIEERGWGHGSSSMLGKSGLCLMGAIHAATFGEFGEDYYGAVTCPAGAAAYDYLNLDRQDDCAGWQWNDRKVFLEGGVRYARTQEEVVSVLRAAAAIESARESEVSPTPADQPKVAAS